MEPKDIEVDMKFQTTSSKREVTITKAIDTAIYYRYTDTKTIGWIRPHQFFKFFEQIGYTKPLDQAMQKLDKVYCTHKNTEKVRYFSAMVYINCKDCGKALN